MKVARPPRPMSVIAGVQAPTHQASGIVDLSNVEDSPRPSTPNTTPAHIAHHRRHVANNRPPHDVGPAAAALQHDWRHQRPAGRARQCA